MPLFFRLRPARRPAIVRLTGAILSGMIVALGLAGGGGPARADIALSQIIVDFEPGDPPVHDIEVRNQGKDRAYVEATVAKVVNPGQWPMQRQTAGNPAELGLIATPGKFILAPEGARLLRLIISEPAGEQERIYRIAVIPRVGEVTDARSGVKVVVGYEVLAIVRPTTMKVQLEAHREGRSLIVRNTGNTNVLIPSVRQCSGAGTTDCASANGTRIYPGRTETISLPRDAPVEALMTVGRKTWSETYR